MIIGITGTLGAGKGTTVEYLVKNRGFKHYSVGGFIADEIRKRGLIPTRDIMVEVGNELRQKHGSGYIATQLYKKAKKQGGNCVIESIRTPGEIQSLKKKDKFILFSVDAPPRLRYERIKKRNSQKDNVSFEKFLADEKIEMNSTDPNKQNLSECIKLADYRFQNNNKIQDLYKQIKAILSELNISL